MSIPVPFFFILIPFASFIFKSTITITDPAYLRQFWYFGPYITNSFTNFSFLHLSQVWSLWSPTISYGSVILLPSSLIHSCWYVDSKALLFSSDFFKLHSLHDFASLTSLFLFIWLNSDSSLRILHMVHTWGILFYGLRHRQGSNFMGRKNDLKLLNQGFLIVRASLIFVWFLSRTAIEDKS